MKPATLALLLAALAPLFTQCGKPAAGPPAGAPPPTTVTVAPVASETIVEWKEFTATVEAAETVELRPRVSGYLQEVHFQAGQLVAEDQLLFTIDQRAFETKLRQAKAEVQRADAVLAAAKKEFERVEPLLAARAIAPEAADARESAFLQAEALSAGAAATLHSAEIEFSHTEVRSPIAGKVSRALVTKGNYVSGVAGGATILTVIVKVDPVHVYVPVDEASLLRLQSLRAEGGLLVDEKGRIPAKMQLGEGPAAERTGFIESFDNRIDAATGNILVRTEFPNPDGALLPGLFARVELPLTAAYEALLIDESAILTDQANKYVLGVSPENTTVYRPIVTGALYQGRRIVREGLKAGESIIVNGQARLPIPGMPVDPSPAPAPGSTPATTIAPPQE